MKILAIETSCDETAIAILEAKNTRINTSINSSIRILSNVVSSQVKIHAKWGGVVPRLAKREHLKNLPLVLNRALKKANLGNPKSQIPRHQRLSAALAGAANIDLIAVTQGPGLEPALWTGINFAKDIAKKWNKPLIGINHLEGHLFSVFLPKNNLKFKIKNLKFPAVLLLVSGGHTQLVLVKDWLKYKILSETRDDAVGEAFDKVARMLNLGYPGGPAIATMAGKFEARSTKFETNSKFKILNSKLSLPRPMINSKDYDFSFSGLKTAVLYKLRRLAEARVGAPTVASGIKEKICAEFQQAVIDVLLAKTMRAAKEHKAKTIIVAGGVAANEELRRQFQEAILIHDRRYVLLLPEIDFSGDNAAMVALAAYFRRNKKRPASLRGLRANGNLRIA